MSAIIVDEPLRGKIAEVIKYAQDNVIDLAGLRKNGQLKEGDPNPIQNQFKHSIENIESDPDDVVPASVVVAGNKIEHVVFVAKNYKVVYSHEDHGQGDGEKIGLGICRHLSMSTSIQGLIPNELAIDMMLEEFGFINPLYNCIVWPERFNESQIAINVIEPIDDWPDNEVKAMISEANKKQLPPGAIESINARRAVSRNALRDAEISSGV